MNITFVEPCFCNVSRNSYTVVILNLNPRVYCRPGPFFVCRPFVGLRCPSSQVAEVEKELRVLKEQGIMDKVRVVRFSRGSCSGVQE